MIPKIWRRMRDQGSVKACSLDGITSALTVVMARRLGLLSIRDFRHLGFARA